MIGPSWFLKSVCAPIANGGFSCASEMNWGHVVVSAGIVVCVFIVAFLWALVAAGKR